MKMVQMCLYEQDSRVSYTFPYIEVSFTDQNCKPLQIEDKINIPLVIN